MEYEDINSGWKIELDAYRGPMDLLLYLIKRDEVDIWDIPIARITEQYVAHMEILRAVNINLAGEFLVMASTLMEIKSKMLLPTEEVDLADIEDPRMELVRQLLEYKRFREAAGELDERAQLRELKFGRPFQSIAVPDDAAEAEPEAQEADLPEDVGLWDLVSAFAKVLKEIRITEPRTIIQDNRTLRQYRIDLLRMLRELHQVRFTAIFEELNDKTAIIGMFLALLELTRSKRARPQQVEEFGEIIITLGEHGHIDIPESSDDEVQDDDRLDADDLPDDAQPESEQDGPVDTPGASELAPLEAAIEVEDVDEILSGAEDFERDEPMAPPPPETAAEMENADPSSADPAPTADPSPPADDTPEEEEHQAQPPA